MSVAASIDIDRLLPNQQKAEAIGMWERVLDILNGIFSASPKRRDVRNNRMTQLIASLDSSSEACFVSLLAEDVVSREEQPGISARMSSDLVLAVVLLQGDFSLDLPVNSLVKISSDTKLYLGEVSAQYITESGKLIYRIDIEHWVPKAPARETAWALAKAS